MIENITTVRGSIEFRDAVGKLGNNGRVFFRLNGTELPVYRIIDTPDPFALPTADDFFLEGSLPPVQAEFFAQTLVHEEKRWGTVPLIDVFNIGA